VYALGLACAAHGCELDTLIDALEPPDGGTSLQASGSGAPAPFRPPAAAHGGRAPRPDAAMGGMQPCGKSCDPRLDAGTGTDSDDAGSDPAPTPESDAFGITSHGRLVGLDTRSGALRFARDIRGLADAEHVLGADIRPADGRTAASVRGLALELK